MSELYVEPEDDFLHPDGMAVGVNGSAVITEEGLDNPLLVLFTSLNRGLSEVDLQRMVAAIPDSKFDLLVVMAFYCRDVLEGNGERRLFYLLFRMLYERNPERMAKVFELIPQYGAWFDMYRMFDIERKGRSMNPVAIDDNAMIAKFADIYVRQLTEDHAKEGTISLAGKWAPREGHHYHWFCKKLVSRVSEGSSICERFKTYRKMVAELNRRLHTVETFLCADATGQTHFGDIDFGAVPSLALRKYRKCFLEVVENNPDRERCRERFLEHIARAESGQAAVHGQLVYPHDFVRDLLKERDEERIRVIEAQWRDLVQSIQAKGSLTGTVIMADFSGSMTLGGYGSVSPLEVAMGLAALGAHVATDAFRGKFLTFDYKPEWHDVSACTTLMQTLKSMQNVSQGCNTDFEAAMELVLQTLKDSGAAPGTEPKQIVVITDMGWDQARKKKAQPWETHVSMLKRKWKEAGYTLPLLIIWNVSSSYREYHHSCNEENVAVISGWNSNIMKMFLDGKDVVKKLANPVQAMMTTLLSDRYNPVREALNR